MTRNGRPEVVVVTGASAGLGRAIVREFAREKAHIGLIARGIDGLDAARKEVEQMGGRALPLPTDVADPEQVEAAAVAVEEKLGPIDIWINDAMATVFAPVKDITPEEFKRVTEVTYLGFVYGTMAALKRMLPRDRGVIVLVGSALAYRGIPLQSAYCGAKHGILGFFESLRAELIHDGSKVRLTMVQMPAMNTPQFEWVRDKMPRKPQPVPPIYQPEIGARAVVYASHHCRREMYVGMPTVKTVIGNKIAPGLLDIYLGKTGYKAQQTDESVEPGRRDNLWKPVPGDRGAHGTFDKRARSRSLQHWADTHRLLVAGIGLAAGLAAGDALRRELMRRKWSIAFCALRRCIF